MNSLDSEGKSDPGGSEVGLTTEPKKKHRRRVRRLIVIGVVLVTLLTAGFFAVRHIWGFEIGHHCIQKTGDWSNPSRALLLYRLALLFDPDRSDARHNRITLFIEMGKVGRAIRECSKWIKARPDDADAYVRKTRILLDQNKVDEAVAVFDELIKVQPEQAQGYIGRGGIYFQLKEYEKALAEYDKAIERGGGKVGHRGHEAHAKRGAVHLQLGDHEKAIADYGRAIEIETEAARAFEKIALARAQQYPGSGAEEVLSTRWRHLATVYDLRRHAYTRAERYDEAMADINKAIELDPENARYLITRGWLHAHGQEIDTTRAIRDLTEAIEKSEQGIEATDQDLQKLTDAPKYTRESLEKYYLELKVWHTKNMAKAHYIRGCMYFHQGEYALAMADLDKTIELNPEYARAYARRARLFEMRGEMDRAFSDVNRAIEVDPAVSSGHYCRGFLLYYMDDYNGALKDFAEVAEIEPITPYAFVWQYLARRRLGQEDAEGKLAEASKSVEMNDWEKAIVDFILDNIAAEEFLKAATDEDPEKQDGKQCEAYFYIGQQYLLAANKEEAQRCFEKSVATGAKSFVEYRAAEKELERMDLKKE